MSKKKMTINKLVLKSMYISVVFIVIFIAIICYNKYRKTENDKIAALKIRSFSSTIIYYNKLLSLIILDQQESLNKLLNEIKKTEDLTEVRFLKKEDPLIIKCTEFNYSEKLSLNIPTCTYIQNDNLYIIHELKSGGIELGYLLKLRKTNSSYSTQLYFLGELLLILLVYMLLFRLIFRHQFNKWLLNPLAELTKCGNCNIQEFKKAISQNDIEEIYILGKYFIDTYEKLKANEKLVAIGQTSAMLAHDVRKPFSQIKLMMNMFEVYKKSPSALEQGKKDIERSINNVESMLNDIMDFSREIQLETKPSHLPNLFDFSIRQIAQGYQECNIAFEYNLNNTLRPLLDDERMARVFNNIIGNAIEAITVIGKKNFGIVSISTCNSKLDNGDNAVTIIIGNDGPLFRNEDLSNLFESFFTKGKKKGTGLGLASAHKIIKLHNGEISARNRMDENGNLNGVEFVITIPASNIPLIPLNKSELRIEDLPKSIKETMFAKLEKNDSQIETIINGLNNAGNKFKILLLEDEALYRASVKNVIKRNETLDKMITMYDAQTVDDAIKLLLTEEITYAIVDIDLGEIKNGFDFLHEVKNRFPKVNCMVHSNRYLDNDKEKAKALGAKLFVSKPLHIEHLIMFLDSKEINLVDNIKTESKSLKAKKVILYSDDEPILCKSFAMKTDYLKNKGYEIKIFNNGEELLSQLKELKSCTAVFTDQHMGDGILGTDLIKEINKLNIPCKKFVVSNMIGDDFVQEAKKAGADNVFNPMTLNEEALNNILN